MICSIVSTAHWGVASCIKQTDREFKLRKQRRDIFIRDTFVISSSVYTTAERGGGVR